MGVLYPFPVSMDPTIHTGGAHDLPITRRVCLRVPDFGTPYLLHFGFSFSDRCQTSRGRSSSPSLPARRWSTWTGFVPLSKGGRLVPTYTPAALLTGGGTKPGGVENRV